MTRPERFGIWRGESYYGQPPLKNPQWDWKVSGYIELAGISGAAQALAWIGGLRDPNGFRHVRRNANLMSLAGTAAGAALLIMDLKTPQRFYNMLRIFRPTSPMSFGSYILGVFGATTVGSVLTGGPRIRRHPAGRAAAEAAQAGAALSGAGAATYTAALMSATSNPYWAAAPRALGAQFATSAVASAAAALALVERADGRRRTAERLEDVAAVASAAHLAASWITKQRRCEVGVEQAASDGRAVDSATTDLIVGGAVPVVAYGLNRASGGRSRNAAVLGSVAVLAGGWLMREGILNSGKRAALKPEAAFRLAQPRHLPGTNRRRDRAGGF